jgi:hypothetical protein
VPIDTSRTIEIAASPARMIVLFLMLIVGSGIVLASLFMPWPWWLEANEVLAFKIVFFVFALIGLGFAVWAGRLLTRLTRRGPVVTIGPQGIRDTRVAAEFIPWRAVRDITTWDITTLDRLGQQLMALAGQQLMVLAVDPAVEQTLSLTQLARWSRAGNRPAGAAGLYIGTSGLDIEYETLLDTTRAYWQAHRA